MSWEYLHLVSHPFPVVLALVGVATGVVGWALARVELERYGVLSLLLAGVFTLPAYYTGIAAADTVARRTFVLPSLVQTHRTWATWAAVALVTTAAFAGISLWQGAERPGDRRLQRFVLLIGVVSCGVAAYAAWLGGHIVHGSRETDGGADGSRSVRVESPAIAIGRNPTMSEEVSKMMEEASKPVAAEALARAGGTAETSSPVRRPAGPVLVWTLLLAAVTFGGPTPLAGQEAAGTDPLEERARRLHEDALVADGHNDLPWRIRNEAGLDIDSLQLDLRSDEGHTDIPRLREGGVDVQFWSTYVPADLAGPEGTAVELEQIDVVKRLAARFPDHLEMAYSAGDVERIVAEGKVASLVGAEGGHVIANSLPVLRELYRAGVRYLTLTHSRTLPWADAATDTARHGGLTDFGRDVVREMNRLGMLVDLSHVSADAMRDAIRTSRAPVIFSHSSARALVDHPRNVPDDVLRMTAENSGVVMVNFYSDFIVPEEEDEDEDESGVEAPPSLGTVATIADHVEHVARVAGVDHVGLGSDFDGVSRLPEGMEDVSKLPALTAELLRRGFTEGEVRKILGENLLRVLQEAEAVAAELQRTEPVPFHRLPYRGLAPEDEEEGGEEGNEGTRGAS